MEFFDAHTHVQFAAFDLDREEVMQRAADAGIGMVNVGTQHDTSAAAIELAEKYENVYAAIGLHPVHTSKSFHDTQELGGGVGVKSFTSRGEIFDKEYYYDLANHPKVVAIGECGLDFFRFTEDEPRDAQVARQKEAFWEQIALAHQVRKTLMVHCRNAFPDLIDVLRKAGHDHKDGIIHFFTGTPEEAKALLALGFSFTFGGVITFARNYDETIKMIPVDHILSETDAPYLSPVPYRGKRNEPLYMTETVKKLAELKGIPFEEMKVQIVKNAKRVFGI